MEIIQISEPCDDFMVRGAKWIRRSRVMDARLQVNTMLVYYLAESGIQLERQQNIFNKTYVTLYGRVKVAD